jgi:plastocyanin
MRFLVGPIGLVPLLALALAVVVSVTTAAAATPTVTIYDNDAPGPGSGFDEAQGYWGYAPAQTHVKKGDVVLFKNNAATKPHTVTSIDRPGSPFDGHTTVGTRFDSSPAREQVIAAGTEWRLDTGGLDPGHYAYYCRLHPWMVGAITVEP